MFPDAGFLIGPSVRHTLLATFQASFSVLLVIFYGYAARRFKLLSTEGEKVKKQTPLVSSSKLRKH